MSAADPKSKGAAPVLEFDHVTVRFEGTEALNNVSFRLNQGQTMVLLGAAGSGKTTLLKAALGLVRPDEGRVRLFGEDITDRDETDLVAVRTKVGILFQEGGLFDSLTVRENVAYPFENQRKRRRPSPDEIGRRVKEALQFVELGHTLDKFPSELSGGMRRRVGIARAIVTNPPLILYDSPTAGLDPITANTIMALLAKGRDMLNTSSLVVTHRFQDGHILANYRYNPSNGQLVAKQDHENLHTGYMVFQEGRLVFCGSEDELHATTDPYVHRFARKMA